MTTKLHIYNTLTGEKDLFKPIAAPMIGMYVCGPTVYSDVHLGNCRTFISFDMVYRYLTHLQYKVRYVRNITDAGHLENDADEGEDKIAKKARLEQLEPMEIVQRYTVDFRKIMEQFNAHPPSIEPTATGHIIEQIEMTKTLIEKGLAYEVNGSVYFDVKKYSENNHYGVVSGRQLDDLLTGTRVLDGQQEKRDQRDFALWKKASPMHIMRWESPWSIGFPGWHLECSVMSSKYLGETFDIHGGGMDLKFPHHECEVAQCVGANGKSPVNYWMHANMLTLNGKRMSKTTGNTILPNELFTGENDFMDKGFSPSVVRFFMMQAHYRKELDFSNDALAAAEKGYTRLMAGKALIEKLETSATSSLNIDEFEAKCNAAMNDDFNTPILIAELFDGVKFINSVKDASATISGDDKVRLQKIYNEFVLDVLGLEEEKVESNNNELLDYLINEKLIQRAEAKENKDYAKSDAIRDELASKGIVIKDSKEGATWELS